MPTTCPPGLDHDWDVSPAEARAIQLRLRERVILKDEFGPVRFVAGTDVAFEDGLRTTRGAVAVLALPSLELVEHAVARRPTSFPYVPGLLSFREIPAILDALAMLRLQPDLVLCDGQGYAHPRRLGLACHLGVLTGLPCIGVAKSRLLGQHATPAEAKGSRVPLLDGEALIGTVLRSRTGVRPLYVSPGHRVGHESAVRFTLQCCTRYRLPETTRWADRLAAAPRSPD